jgi:hypothetical protein
MSNVYSGWSIQQIDYTVLDGTSIGYSFPHLAAGASASSSLPPECAPVLTLLTNKRGRRYRGRIFLPAPHINLVAVSGQLGSTTITGIQTQYQGLISALQAIQWVPVVASYGVGSYKGQPTTWTPFATPIVSARMDGYIDVQRRRKN